MESWSHCWHRWHLPITPSRLPRYGRVDEEDFEACTRDAGFGSAHQASNGWRMGWVMESHGSHSRIRPFAARPRKVASTAFGIFLQESRWHFLRLELMQDPGELWSLKLLCTIFGWRRWGEGVWGSSRKAKKVADHWCGFGFVHSTKGMATTAAKKDTCASPLSLNLLVPISRHARCSKYTV